MKLLIRQRIFSWTDNYDVYDAGGRPRYAVESDLFTIGYRIRVYDKKTGREMGLIRERLLHLMPTFEIEIGGRVCGTVRKAFSLFSPRYSIDCLDWEVSGNLFGWDYEVSQGGRTVMTISREPLSLSDTYTLNYEDPAAEMPGLLLVLAIDAANCSDH